MNYLCKIFLITFILFSFPYSYNAEPTVELLGTYEKDVTGDKRKETIELFGVPFSPESNYYQQNFIVINSEDNQWRIDYQGGYDPVVIFKDLNQDGVDDILFQSATGGSGGLYLTELHTLASYTLSEIPLPEQEFVDGEFKDGFYAEIVLTLADEPVKINVETKKEEYIELGMYDKDGNIKKETSLMIDPIAFFEPIYISESQGYGMKSYKPISGAYHANRLGVIETLWYFENDTWKIMQTKWNGVE